MFLLSVSHVDPVLIFFVFSAELQVSKTNISNYKASDTRLIFFFFLSSLYLVGSIIQSFGRSFT